ncbi:MAG: hypothetical protein ACPF83_06605 [Flavobacteriales bacterium]
MENRIVSFEKLPRTVQNALAEQYPDGYDDVAFDFRIPTRNEVYRALRFVMDEVTYLIKLEKKRNDRPDVLDVI